MTPEQRELLHDAIYAALYNGGAQFDRDSVVPAVAAAVLEVLAATPRVVFTGVADDFDPAEFKPGPLVAVPDETRVFTIPTPRQVLLDAAEDVEDIDRICATPKRDVTDDEFVRIARSPLFSLTLTRADFIRYLRERATQETTP